MKAEMQKPTADPTAYDARPVKRARLWDLLPRGGSLPQDVWRRRHHVLLGLAWFHAIVIALVGPMVGYPMQHGLVAFFRDGTSNHTILEGLIVAVFALLAAAPIGRSYKATAVGLALMSASAILVHLSGGYIELHFHFFVMLTFLALYQDWMPYLVAVGYVLIHHGFVGALWPEEVYNHAAAIQAPWTWAGIHAFFVAWASVGSVIAWRFSEAAFARTKLILDVAGDGICGVDLEGKITFANPAAVRMLGLAGQKIVGRDMAEVVGHASSDGSDFPDGGSPIVRALKQGASCVSSDEIFKRSDGTTFVVDYVSNPIFEQGKLTGAVVAFTDVTHRKHAQEELSERYNELSTLYEVGQMIFASNQVEAILEDILDRALKLLSLDVGNLRLFSSDGNMRVGAYRGYRDRDNLGRYERSGGPPILGGFLRRVVATKKSVVIDDVAASEGLRSFKSEGAQTAIIVPITTADETWGVIEAASRTARSFRPDEVRTLEAIGHQVGIALQKARLVQEAERRAKQQEALYTIASTATQSLETDVLLHLALKTTIEVLGVDAGRFYVTDAENRRLTLAAHYGIPRDEIAGIQEYAVGEGVIGRILSEFRPLVFSDIESDPQYAAIARNAMGRKLGFRCAAGLPITVKGRPIGVIYVYGRNPREFTTQDIELLSTIGGQIGVALENARLFEQLSKNAEELARSNSELQHFAYIASHDLQEPLRMVSSYMQLLSRRYKGKLDVEADEFIAFAVEGAQRMQALINALLSYSRVGTQGKAFERVDCEKVLDGTLAGLKRAIEESGAEIVRGPLPTITADPAQLGQLFQNLVGNALKFRDHRRPVVRIAAERKDKEWVFSVADNGVGFEAKYAERVFVMFQRLHSKDEYPGTGIGLAVCKKIVERHGGRIWVESAPGHGSTFYFTVPG
jgi:PAS domain S-box-containing protein